MNEPMQANPDLYQAGGALSLRLPTYVERAADRELFDALVRKQYCYVLTARQMGKSSLVVRTRQKLEQAGIATVLIDLTSIRSADVTEEQWYWGHAEEIADRLGLASGLEDFWQRHTALGPVQRLSRFLADYVLKGTQSSIVICVDEIDSTIGLRFSDDYFAVIRALYNRRAVDSALERITFALLGSASPSDLIKDALRTPFNIGKRIDLTDFTREEAAPLVAGLAPEPDLAERLLDRVMYWTAGHPYLSQKTCEEVAKWAQERWDPREVPGIVDMVVKRIFLSTEGKTDSNLQLVSSRVRGGPAGDKGSRLLTLYRQIVRGERVSDEDVDPVKVALKLSGLIVSSPTGLRVRNRVYETVFDEAWIRSVLGESAMPTVEQKPAHDVFISYSTEDRLWVKDYLLPALRAAGLDVVSDLDLLPGAQWQLELPRLREDSRYFLPVLSPAWARSRGAQEEFALMSNRVGNIVPVLLRPTELPPFLREIQFADFTDPVNHPAAMSSLIRALGGKQSAAPAPPAPQVISTAPKPQQLQEIAQALTERYSAEELLKVIYAEFPTLVTQLDRSRTQDDDGVIPAATLAQLIVHSATAAQRPDALQALLEVSRVHVPSPPRADQALARGQSRAFVAMPFGSKPGLDGQAIDFNRVYQDLIRPALEAANLAPLRADEEVRAGDIRTDMFQELLLADLVVADLTIDNPNVWYELGVRHALRARGVVLISGGRSTTPFDVYTDRKLRYSLKNGVPDPATIADDKRRLTDMIKATMESWHGRKVSPVYQLLPNLQEPDWKSLRIGDVREFWEQHSAWESRIDLARRAGRIGDLLVLAEEAPVAAFRADAWFKAGEALRKAERYRFALEHLERGLEIAPKDLRALREKGICLQRLASMEQPGYSIDRVREHYRRVLQEFPDDPETWGLLGRVDKDAWTAAWRRPDSTPDRMREDAAYDDALLRAAIDSYSRAFHIDPRHYYSGINALTLMYLYMHLTGDERYRSELPTLEGALRFAVMRETDEYMMFWAKVTIADLEVFVSPPDRVRRAYKDAIAKNDRDWFALRSSLTQLQLLRDLGFRPDAVEAGIATFERAMSRLGTPEEKWQPRQVLLFSGHIIDAPGRPTPRFPPDKETTAAHELAQALDALDAGPDDLALCQAAAGGDLMFLEACLVRGVRCQVLLPFAESEFISRSVMPSSGGEKWRGRFYAAKSRLTQPIRVMPVELGPAPKDIDPFERCNLWLLYTALACGIDKVRFITLWNGGGGDGPGGTSHMYHEVQRRTGRVTWIDTRTL